MTEEALVEFPGAIVLVTVTAGDAASATKLTKDITSTISKTG